MNLDNVKPIWIHFLIPIPLVTISNSKQFRYPLEAKQSGCDQRFDGATKR